MKFKFNKKLYFIPVVMWMIIIFLFSSQPATVSGDISGGVTKRVAELIEKIIPIDINFDVFDHYIRKLSHIIEYMILGILVYMAFSKNDILRNKRVLCCILVCVIYASSDELHQVFVPGRAGRITDIMIDSFGSTIGVLLSKNHIDVL